MNESEKMFALIPFVAVVVLFLFALFHPGLALTKGDFVKLSENYADIGTSYTIYEISLNNPAPTTIKVNERPVIDFIHIDGQKAPANIKFEIRKSTDMNFVPLQTFDLSQTFPANSKFYLKVSGQTTNGTKSDNILSILGYTFPEYAWWNVSFGLKKLYWRNNTNAFNFSNAGMVENVTFETGMNADFSDIRKTFLNKSTGNEDPLNFAILEKVNSVYALIGYVLPFEYAGSTETYTYYKNSTPVTFGNSTGHSVFPLFDNFDDASLNTSTGAWTTGGTCTARTESGGILRMVGSGGTDCYVYQAINRTNFTIIARSNMSANDNYLGLFTQLMNLPLQSLNLNSNSPPADHVLRNWAASQSDVQLGGSCKNTYCLYTISKNDVGTGGTYVRQNSLSVWGYNNTAQVGITPMMPAIQVAQATGKQDADYIVGFYAVNYASAKEGYGSAEAIPSVTADFVDASPSDITSTNLFNSAFRVRYNFTASSGSVNNSATWLYFKTNSTTSDCLTIINGTEYCGFNRIASSSNASFLYNFTLSDNQIYSEIANLNTTLFTGNSSALNHTITANRQGILTVLGNVSTSKQYSVVEISSYPGSGTNPANVRFCNSTCANFECNYLTSPNCAVFGTLTSANYCNHTHGDGVCHAVFPFPISGGAVAGVKVTNPLAVIVDIGTGANWTFPYLPVNVRNGQTKTTNNPALSFTNQTFTFPTHAHQNDGTDTFRHYASVTAENGATNSTTIRSDLIDLGDLPPSAPNVFSPVNATIYNNQSIFCNWTASVSPNAYSIVNYSVDAIFSSNVSSAQSFGNTTSLFALMNLSNLTGDFNCKITAFDQNGLTAFGLSESFTILASAGTTTTTTVPPTTTTTIPSGGATDKGSGLIAGAIFFVGVVLLVGILAGGKVR